MDLRSIRSRNYKTILDSNWVTIDPEVTCLIGKNESGKTTLLETVHRLNPGASGPAVTFEPLRDYPRRLYARDRASVPDRPVIHALFELDAGDLDALFEEFGDDCLRSSLALATKGFANELTWQADVDTVVLLDHVKLDKRLSGVDVTNAASIEELCARIDEIEYPTAPLQEIRDELRVPPHERLHRRLSELAPPAVSFTRYDVLPGSVSVRRLQSVPADELRPGERTALSLLRLAGVESEAFDEPAYEARKAALEAAANTLTDEIFEFWSQDADLQIELDIEWRRPGADSSGDEPEPFLQIRVRDTRHRVTLNVDERSAGFVWFFSFLACFSEFRDGGRRHVLLLDEPGANLHGTAQRDLLRFIDERLAPDHQVIYTTHSPFMVPAERLERARFVEEVDDEGTLVTDTAAGTDEATQLPLLAAVSLHAGRTVVDGRPTLLVEGPADAWYLRTMSRLLRRRGRAGLHDDWAVLPVGGTAALPAFLALTAPSAPVVALHDVPHDESPEVQRLVDRGTVTGPQLLPLTETGESKGKGGEATIEDLFEDAFYLELLRRSGTATPAADEVKGGGRVVVRVEDALGHTFSRTAPAQHLAVHADELDQAVPEATLDRFESLFKVLEERRTA